MTVSEIIEDFEDALKMGGYGDYLDKESIEFALKTIKETYPDAKGTCVGCHFLDMCEHGSSHRERCSYYIERELVERIRKEKADDNI